MVIADHPLRPMCDLPALVDIVKTLGEYLINCKCSNPLKHLTIRKEEPRPRRKLSSRLTGLCFRDRTAKFPKPVVERTVTTTTNHKNYCEHSYPFFYRRFFSRDVDDDSSLQLERGNKSAHHVLIH